MGFVDKKQFAELLTSNQLMRIVGWSMYDAGKYIADSGDVTVVAYSDSSAECQVKDKYQRFDVTLQVQGNHLVGLCECAQSHHHSVCKHIVAAGVAVHKILSEEIKNSWENRLLFTYSASGPAKIPRTAPDYLLVFALCSDYYGWKVKPLVAPISRIPGAAGHNREDWTREFVVDFLANSSLVRSEFKSQINFRLTAEACQNAPAPIVALAKMLANTEGNTSSYYTDTYTVQAVPGALEILREADFPLYLGSSDMRSMVRIHSVRPLEICADMADILLDIENTRDGNLRLQFHLTLGNSLWKLTKKPTVISQSPIWLLLDDRVIPAQNSVDETRIDHLGKASRLVIPASEKDYFLETYLPVLASQFTITGQGIKTNEITEKPQPRLYLQDNQGVLDVWLKYGYGEYEVSYQPRVPETSSAYDAETSTFTRIFRDADAERAAFPQVSDFGLKRVTGSPGLFNLRARVHIVDFLMRYIPKALEAGFEVYGEENIKNVRINRNPPAISFHISSGIDWFDLESWVNYGEMRVPLSDVRRALRRQEKYIKLADGTIGQIPDEWLERYKHIFGLGEETDQGLRFSNSQVTLLDELLGDSASAKADEEFQRQSQRLKDFSGIQPQPLPQNFAGEMRPYQKAGVDWLHFLHEYHFGGCLADDMGLGKTIQVLAFLQALKEKQASPAASLIVVPRSLLVNWQREAEKFAPELRVLEYHGQQREKDASIFDQYDLILTTYGIVIRDIEFLRGYRFHYVVLDESQAIKNPVSQSAKACRALKSEHRLVMTGTPVENSTIELWSQFAFLNPGLLGNLEYFKSEIGGPIEKGGDQETAQFLRKLVYPFILRRTKDQVAPELPPREERIVYGEMGPAQRKLYLRTRDTFRKSILGLIEDQGMNNARMKILEGLLRLRQICIHPRLVDAGYNGDSPKFELLLYTIDNLLAEGHKALIFSQFVETLKLVRTELDGRKIRYAYLDGQTQNRQEQVDRFQNDPACPFFLISLKAGGLGLNLTAAEYVIHLDPWWNPAVEMQASDRAHRIGQEKTVFIYKYILRDSVEEKILLLQERKKNLVDQLITTDTSFFKAITTEDVRTLFS